ncbi:hypothetical protein [Hydrogenophaga sp. 2FB]|uniref:hypothetical protein n=1 Tax=Hydrogenophaga sp. 2FB TaxID=2502187 RepID=UPI0010F75091|nr:hypothetical protein [Hydrogenophaga sp. 2FB]
MQISLLLDRFHVQSAARAQLHPLDDFSAWIETTHAAALTAAGAIQALDAVDGFAQPLPVQRSMAALESLRATCTRRDLLPHLAVRDCEEAFSDMCELLRASCDHGLL